MDRDNETPRKRMEKPAYVYTLTVTIDTREPDPGKLICDAMMQIASLRNVKTVKMQQDKSCTEEVRSATLADEDKSSTAEADCSASSQGREN